MSATASSSTDLFLLWRLSALHVLSCSIDRAGCAASDALSSGLTCKNTYFCVRVRKGDYVTAAFCAPDEHRIILGAKCSPMGRWATSAYRDAIETVESHRGLVRTVIANRFRFLCREHHLSMPRRAIVLRMLSAKIAPNRLGLKKIAIYALISYYL